MPQERIQGIKQIYVDDILNLIGMEYIEEVVQELEADKWVAKLKTPVVFKLILYSLLSVERISLRSMAENYSNPLFKALERTAKGSTRHSSIRDRLVRINSTVFERLYHKVREELSKHYDDKPIKGHIFNVKRFDSTMIAVFGYLLEGMKVGNTSKEKRQVKITTELENEFGVSFSFFKDQAHLSEETALKELIESSTHTKNDLIVFDRGLKSRETFVKFKDQIRFVTRLNDKCRYKVIRPADPLEQVIKEQEEEPPPQPDLEIIQDSIVYLYGDGGKLVEEEFRLIEAKRVQDGKILYFLTNMIDFSPQLTACIYKKRWDIEVFFRFVKQELHLTHFVCNDANAIQVMLYCTLIVAMMILVYKKKNDISSYKIAKIRFVKELQSAVILALLETQENLDRLKYNLKNCIKKNE